MDEQIFSLLNKMYSRFDFIDSELTNMKSELSEIHTDVRNIKLHLENVTDQNIKLLAENVSSANERLMSIDSDVRELKDNQVIADVLSQLSTAIRR